MVLLDCGQPINVNHRQEIICVSLKQLNGFWIIIYDSILKKLDSTIKDLLNSDQLSRVMSSC